MILVFLFLVKNYSVNFYIFISTINDICHTLKYFSLKPVHPDFINKKRGLTHPMWIENPLILIQII